MNRPKRNVWDEIYASGGYGEKEPDGELASLCASAPSGKALDVGGGDGRHSLWLAAHGWDVEAVDVSSEGIANLQHEALKHGLTIRTSVGSMTDHDFRVDTYDLALSTGSALNLLKKHEAKEMIAKLKAAVVPGGHVYLTLSTVDDPAYQRHRAKADEVQDDSFWSSKTDCWINAFQPNELKQCFPEFEVVSYAEKVIHDTHGNPHDHVYAFMVARRPNDG